MAISIFSFQFSSALDFSLNSPASAESGEPFIASISASSSLQCDVKIFVQDENNKIISEIFSNGWKNPFYFLKSSFPNQTEFRIMVLNSSGNYKICARLRESGKKSFTEKCNEITISSSSKKTEEIPEESPEEDKEKEASEEDEDKEENSLQEDKEISPSSALQENTPSILPLSAKETSSPKKIILLQQNNKDSQVFTTKYETIRNFILYSFTAFCVVLIVFLALKQL